MARSGRTIIQKSPKRCYIKAVSLALLRAKLFIFTFTVRPTLSQGTGVHLTRTFRYNSVIFAAKGANQYAVITATSEFASGGYYNASRLPSLAWPWFGENTLDTGVRYLQQNVTQLVRLENTGCVRAYGQNFVSDMANLIIVTNISSPDAILNYHTVYANDANQGDWVCNGPDYSVRPCSTPSELVDAAKWRVPGSTAEDFYLAPDYSVIDRVPCCCQASVTESLPVEYCLEQQTPEDCQVAFAVGLLIAVTVCNFIKPLCFYWYIRRSSVQPLLTLGNAVESFLEVLDPQTTGYGAASSTELNLLTDQTNGTPAPWDGRRRFGFHAASCVRWICYDIEFLLFWFLALVILILGLRNQNVLSTRLRPISPNGICQLNLKLLVYPFHSYHATFIAYVVVANTPQLIISALYMAYNDLFTRVHLSKEGTSYASRRKPLRTSQPRGLQRNTYFLSLPTKFSIPLIVTMTLLHWLAPQSIFVALVRGHDFTDIGASPVDLGYVINDLAWSPFALLLRLILATVILLSLWLAGLTFRYPGTMPLARSCSLLISAACHPPAEEAGIAEKPLMYGVVEGAMVDGRPRASFSSKPVRTLVVGERYC